MDWTSPGSLHATEQELHHSTHPETPWPQPSIYHWGGRLQLQNRGHAISTRWESREGLPLCIFLLEVNHHRIELWFWEPEAPIHLGSTVGVETLAGGGTTPISSWILTCMTCACLLAFYDFWSMFRFCLLKCIVFLVFNPCSCLRFLIGLTLCITS